ncbi:MAG: hypothetical protein ACI4VJ_06695 [Methanosphaera sp.]|uniref:hypothetical protein n=1 Tax=Methanosphaera TaxID=2316 RepID=UPI002380B753|nr:hypothetical protein [Candidatus Methanosphaera massiliense]MDD6285427.1 hypothetical protein [Methanobacteriaceae archaeon]MDE4077481.1 hypothetical protein [Candidatus Methanosphaera massiliense]MDY2744184.1 hypothetical protein [Methanosphaera sp.]
MQIITKQENRILMFIKNNLDKYPESLSYDTIRDVLDLSETKVVDLLNSLQKKNFIFVDQDTKMVTYNDLDVEVKIVEDKSALKTYMLNKTEEEAYVIIQDVISQYDGYAPRYILEGALLYGELGLSTKRTYNITVALENKQLLKRVKRADGEYYTI